jgi:molecular chaperone Hsp33
MMDSHLDTLLGFTIPGLHARGRLVRLGPVLDQVLAAHGYPAPIEKILAEALALTALLGSTLKDDAGQMTLQAQTEAGVIDLLVCDYRAGELRGYVKFDAERLAEIPADPTLFALFGKGYLAITFDQAVSGERYQGIVPLDGVSLADAAEAYFCQSEQIPTLVRFATAQGGPDGCRAGGLLLQHLPEGEEGRERLHTRLDHPDWEHVRVLGETIRGEELTDPDLALETIVWRLFNEEDEVRLLAEAPMRKGCRCDPAHIRGVISRFPEDEQREMADDDGLISVDCAFCARVFAIPLETVAAERG